MQDLRYASRMLNWQRIQAVVEPTAERHAKAAKLVGLTCPAPVFRALFHGCHADPDIARLVHGVDWLNVEWTLQTRSGAALREVGVDRPFQSAVDAAYASVIDEGVVHARDDVIASWREHGTWAEPPIMIEGDLLGSSLHDLLLVGYTRLGCLRAFLDQGFVAESARHEVWVGRRIVPSHGDPVP
jgi:hypothetical protein